MTHKLFYFLGTLILVIALIFNMRHSLDNYGFLTNSLMPEIFAQSSCSGEYTSTLGTLTYECTSGACRTETFPLTYATARRECYTKGAFSYLMTMDIITSTTCVMKCIRATVIINNSNCEYGTRVTRYVHNDHCEQIDAYISQQPHYVSCPKER